MEKSDKKQGLILLLALVGAYLTVMMLLADNTFIFQAFLIWGSNLAIAILLIGPFVWMNNRKKHDLDIQRSTRLLSLVVFIFFIELLMLLSGYHINFFELDWNWPGKLLSLSIAVMFVALWSGLSWRDIGVTAPRRGSWLRVCIILGGTAVFWILAASAGEQTTNINVETILFQATMPGLEEEFIFRGILWVLIAQALPGSRRLWGANVGWNIIITTLLFAGIHGISFDDNLSFIFDPAILIFSAVSGFILGWIRAYSESIIPAIVLHNGINLIAVIVPWIV